MQFDPPLVSARLISRYKRFLFDAILEDGTEITGSCPNTGSMRGLTTPGSRILLSEHDSPSRKYRHMLEMVEADGTLVGINTGLPNRLAEEAVVSGLIPALSGYATLKREQRYGQNSRIDLLLLDDARPPAYIEVKNVHYMRQPGLAEFPDSVTSRGAKHLDELAAMVTAGYRAAMLYVIQRADCTRLRICEELDPAYGVAFRRARAQGVETYAVSCTVSPQGIRPERPIPIDEDGPAG
ncbi:sugar fermentation stimulation protein A [Rhizobium sp. RU35A]|uniref:DNA/RNA nuclease SfsA n=1 Tax=Rhizobium sp. RU35A TaxID=1907414 RepID=UPI000956673E|nr:DNA/RNA nuclease SfsA [Rhizobium sp. RU35A]SIQ79555.1 sugar fermentation stimulation protein A [Rhizobium sp. RU35A]